MKALLYQDGNRSILCVMDLGIIIYSEDKLVFASNKKEEILGIERKLRGIEYREIELKNYHINDLKEITFLYKELEDIRKKVENKSSRLMNTAKKL